MSGNKGLIDSNILIYLSNGELEITDLFNKYEELLISRITHMEVLGFRFKSDEDEEWARKLVGEFSVLEIDNTIGEITIDIRKKNKIKLPDAIILATAKAYKCDLITANEKDFKGIDEKVVVYNPLSIR